jgi:hypothetical protein
MIINKRSEVQKGAIKYKTAKQLTLLVPPFFDKKS